MEKYIKGVIIIFLIIADSLEMFCQNVKFRHLNINNGLSLNAVLPDLKKYKCSKNKYLCHLSDFEGGILNRSVHLGLLSFNNSINP
jgi:hypothetical protein